MTLLRYGSAITTIKTDAAKISSSDMCHSTKIRGGGGGEDTKKKKKQQTNKTKNKQKNAQHPIAIRLGFKKQQARPKLLTTMSVKWGNNLGY